VQVFLVTADGLVVDNPRHPRTAERDLQNADRRVSRRQKGSNRRRKAVHLRAKQHQQARRPRQGSHHKAALQLVRADDTISLDDVRVAHLVRNRHLSTSISDAGWAQFRSILEGNAAYAGRRVVGVPPAYNRPGR
jgi:putative transposase